MPPEEMWATFFDAGIILDRLGLRDLDGDIVDFGCGYGTFTIPAALRTTGIVWAFDVEAEMIAITRQKAEEDELHNIVVVQRDFMAEGTGLPAESCDAVIAFNILHAAQPLPMLTEAYRILRPGGTMAILHWIPDPATPRGPAIAIRPTPQQSAVWLKEARFTNMSDVISLPPYHYGLTGCK